MHVGAALISASQCHWLSDKYCILHVQKEPINVTIHALNVKIFAREKVTRSKQSLLYPY